MGALVWGILVLVLCPLLQIPVIVYIARYLEVESDTDSAGIDTETDHPSNESGYSPAPTQGYWVGSDHRQPLRSFDSGSSEETGSSTITCPHCGTENDRIYTYCRNCVARLPTIGTG